jgi:CRP-like cAMP-binding protein
MDRLDVTSGTTFTENYDQHFGASSLQKRSRQSVPVINTNNQLLRALPKQLFDKIKGSLRTVSLAKDQFLFLQDDDLDYVYFPETAVVSELKTLDDGRTVEVALEGNEGAVGLTAVFCHSKAANCSQVAQAGSAIRIEREVLEKMARLHPELSTLLLPDMDHYIRQISQRAICNMYHSVKERFCTWLLMLQDRSGKKTLKLTHEQIARTLGVYRPSVTCIALEMRADGLIDYSRGGITIKDRKKMEEAACPCYFELGCTH